MAEYKIVNAEQLDNDLASVAACIKNKLGRNDCISFPEDFVRLINSMNVISNSDMGMQILRELSGVNTGNFADCVNNLSVARDSMLEILEKANLIYNSEANFAELAAMFEELLPYLGNGGILDVEELPETDIKEDSIYRITEDCKVSCTDVYAVVTNGNRTEVTSLVTEYAANISVEDELPSNMRSSDLDYGPVYAYIVKSDGRAYLKISGTVVTVGALFFGSAAYDRGLSENVYSETRQGIYTSIEKHKTLHKYYVHEDGKWRELTAYIRSAYGNNLKDFNMLSGEYTRGGEITVKTNGSVVDIGETIIKENRIPKIVVDTPDVAELILGNFNTIDERWFRQKDGTMLNVIRPWCFANTTVYEADIPSSVEFIQSKAFLDCNNLQRVVFRNKPQFLSDNVFEGCKNLSFIGVPWSEGEVRYAPWGAPEDVWIEYNYIQSDPVIPDEI